MGFRSYKHKLHVVVYKLSRTKTLNYCRFTVLNFDGYFVYRRDSLGLAFQLKTFFKSISCHSMMVQISRFGNTNICRHRMKETVPSK